MPLPEELVKEIRAKAATMKRYGRIKALAEEYKLAKSTIQNIVDWKSHTGKRKAPYGSSHGSAKVDEAKVRELRRLRKEGWSLQKLKEKYGLATSTIWLITQCKSWKHVTDED